MLAAENRKAGNMPLIPWAQAGRTPSIAVIGAGMSGIAAAVKLRQAGYTDITIYEKADRVGGTWRENTYPGLSCDIPSHWYTFTFAPNPDWSHRYAYGPEIQAYMERVCDTFDVTPCIQFNTPVTDLVYKAPCWLLTTKEGTEHIYDIVISATGILHHPVSPALEGLQDFEGRAFHTARWDHTTKLEGKRVGVIGTGSTASQIVGEITKDVDKMFVFQRTPQWMAPLPQEKYSSFWKTMLWVFPFLQKLVYHYHFQMMIRGFGRATTGDSKMQERISAMCLENLNDNVPDPELRAKLTPDYQAACKRLVFCSNFYPAISRDNACLVTDAISRVTPKGVETVDGKTYELDVLVFATGFDPKAFVLPIKVTGERALDLATLWDGAPRAYRAVAMPGFPNFWMLEGPTGPVGNLSLITISERQVDYIIHMLNQMKKEKLQAIAVKQEAFELYNHTLKERMPRTVWASGGCTSWYMDKTGMPNLYPFPPMQYLKEMRRPVFSDFRLIEDVSSEESGNKESGNMDKVSQAAVV